MKPITVYILEVYFEDNTICNNVPKSPNEISMRNLF